MMLGNVLFELVTPRRCIDALQLRRSSLINKQIATYMIAFKWLACEVNSTMANEMRALDKRSIARLAVMRSHGEMRAKMRGELRFLWRRIVAAALLAAKQIATVNSTMAAEM